MNQFENSGGGLESSQGTVLKKGLGKYHVRIALAQEDHAQANAKFLVCSISNQLRKQLIYPIAAPTSISRHVVAVREIEQVDPVAVGDVVRFIQAGDGTGVIMEVMPRRTKFARRDPGGKPLEQVIVANVDQVIVVVAAAQPSPKWHLVDRYLAAAEESGLPAVLCVTKRDIAESDIVKELKVYEKAGYVTLLTSALTGAGIQEFKASLAGRVSILAGQSGVGKTTLLNRIQPGLGLRVAEVSKSTGKGKHTTSHLEMFPLDSGGSIVDTPGIKYLTLWNVQDVDLSSLFREMQPLRGLCRFGAWCTHMHEPGCAIRRAVENGQIDERRYRSYVKMREG